MSWLLTLTALLPATWYGEGLRRAFVSLAGSGPDAAPVAGWRGRLLILPVLAVAPVLLLGLLLVLTGAARRLQDGGWSSVGAVVVSSLAAWLALSPAFVMVYRWCAPPTPGLAPDGRGRRVHGGQRVRLRPRVRAVLVAAAEPRRALRRPDRGRRRRRRPAVAVCAPSADTHRIDACDPAGEPMVGLALRRFVNDASEEFSPSGAFMRDRRARPASPWPTSSRASASLPC